MNCQSQLKDGFLACPHKIELQSWNDDFETAGMQCNCLVRESASWFEVQA